MSSLWSTKEGGAPTSKQELGMYPWGQGILKGGKAKTHHNVAKHLDLSQQAKGPKTAKALEDAAEASKQILPATVYMTERAKMDWTKTQPKGPSVGLNPGQIHPETGEIVKGVLPEARVVTKEVGTVAKVAKGAAVGLEVGGKVVKTVVRAGSKALPILGAGVCVGEGLNHLKEGRYLRAGVDFLEAIPLVGDLVLAADLGLPIAEAAADFLFNPTKYMNPDLNPLLLGGPVSPDLCCE